MASPYDFPASIPLLALSLVGLVISIYLFYSQQSHKKPHCVIGKNCDIVINSQYASTFGIPNTVLGIFYYLLLIVYASVKYSLPLYFGALVPFAAAIASLFSIYLVYLQAFVLKEWCDYCVLSAIINWSISLFLL